MAVLINPLKAGALGDPTNSIGSDVANAVNTLIAAAQAADASIISMQAGKSDISHSHPLATSSSNGFMSSSDKVKLDSLVASGSSDAYLLDRNNHTGFQDMSTITGLVPLLASKSDSNHTHPDATTLVSGFLSFTDKAKLNSIASGATLNQTDSYLLNRTNHTGSQAISTITGLSVALDSKANSVHGHSIATVTVAGFMSSIDKTKLDNIASGATANQTDVFLLSRANHTGTQPILSIDGLQSALDGKSSSNHGHSTATTSLSGFMSSVDKAKLDGISNNATSNQTDAHLLARSNHTGVQAIATISGLETALADKQPMLSPGPGITIDTATWTISSTGGSGGGTTDHSALVNRNAPDQHAINSITGLAGELAAKASVSHSHGDATISVSGFMSYTDKAKLNGIASGATANQADSFLLDRANHTGSQAISTVANLQTTLDSKQPLATQLTTLVTNINAAGTGIFKKTAANTWSFATLATTDIPSLAASKITSGTFTASLIPPLDAAKITTGTFSAALIPGLDASSIAAGTLPLLRGGTGRTDGKAVALATPVLINGVSFDGSANITVPMSGAASSLATAKNIVATGDANWSVSFDGSADVSGSLTLVATGVAAGTYRSVTVNAKGLVTGGTNPTTLLGYGITDAQPLDADLTSIAGLSGTLGLLRKTAANTWSLDVSTTLAGFGITDAVSTSGNQTVNGVKVFTSAIVSSAGAALVARGGAGEGGQIVLGYGNNLATSINGQGNNTWNIDVDNSNDLRIFMVNSSGTSLVPITVEDTSGLTTVSKGISLSDSGTVAQLNLAAMAATPSTPVNGDIWHKDSALNVRLAGVSQTVIHSGNPTALALDATQVEAETGTNTSRKWFTPQLVAQAIAAQAAPKVSTNDRITALENAPDSSLVAQQALAIAIMGM